MDGQDVTLHRMAMLMPSLGWARLGWADGGIFRRNVLTKSSCSSGGDSVGFEDEQQQRLRGGGAGGSSTHQMKSSTSTYSGLVLTLFPALLRPAYLAARRFIPSRHHH